MDYWLYTLYERWLHKMQINEEGVIRMNSSSQLRPYETTQQFRVFSLPGVLPAGNVLVLNTHPYSLSTFVLTQLSPEGYGLVAQEAGTELEMYVRVALLSAYPHYCPYEALPEPVSAAPFTHARS